MVDIKYRSPHWVLCLVYMHNAGHNALSSRYQSTKMGCYILDLSLGAKQWVIIKWSKWGVIVPLNHRLVTCFHSWNDAVSILIWWWWWCQAICVFAHLSVNSTSTPFCDVWALCYLGSAHQFLWRVSQPASQNDQNMSLKIFGNWKNLLE